MSIWDNQNSDQQQPQYGGASAMAQEYAHPMFAADAAQSERTAFIQRTYLHVGLAILLLVILEVIALKVIAPAIGEERLLSFFFSGYNWLILVGSYMGVSYLANMWAHSTTSREVQYFGLVLYVVALSVMFMPALLIADMRFDGAIESAGISTLFVFGGLTAFTFITKADFSFLRGILVVASMAAFAIIIASIFTGGGLGTWFSVAMVILFSGYILYDTSNIMHHYRTDQHVAASLALFASVAMLFYYILMLFMNRD